jgi:1-phosphofructokinase family hexose kinase
MIVTVTLNPSVDHTLFIDGLHPNDANRVRRVERDAGGKGLNLSRVYAELGGETLALGLQPHGASALIRQVLEEQGASHDFVEVPGETRVNISVEDGSGEPPTTFNEPGAPTPDGAWEAVLQRVRERAAGAAWIAVGGSIPPGIGPEAYAQLVQVAQELGVAILVDADREALKLAVDLKPDMIKPNEDEAARLLGWPSEEIRENPERALAAMKDMARIVLLTLGADGAWLEVGDQVWHAVPPKIEAKSTIGSGDSLLAGVLYAHEQGNDWGECLRLGVACGAATAMTDGSEIARRPVVESLISRVDVRKVALQ